MNLFKFTCMLGLTFFCSLSYGQGAWNIRYLPLSSLDSSIIGREIRLDFKSSATDTLAKELQVRSYLSKNDQVDLIIDCKVTPFKENWKVYVDHGSLYEQNLINTSNPEEFIKEIFINSLTNSHLTVTAYLYRSKNDKSFVKKIIKIEKSLIKGVLITSK